MESKSGLSPILIIDDEPAVLRLLSQCLSRKGYCTDTAETGEAGLKKIKVNQYSLVITDIKMPGLSGSQVLDVLRNKLKKSIPVVGMSGTPWLLDQTDFDAVLQKPSSIKEILTVIEQLIGK